MAKRFKVTKNGKVIKRAAGQGHFNARESGNVTRAKRRDPIMSESFGRTIRRLAA